MVIKKLLFLLLLLPSLSEAQAQRTSKLYYNYDVSSTSYIYCRYVGGNGSPTGSEIQGYGLIKTTGSSTTLDELDSASDSFTGMAVGDLLTVRLPNGTVYNRRIVTFTSVSQVVVDAAVDLGTTGVAFTWMRQQCGTAATDGWIDVAGFWKLNFQRVLTTINATSIQTQMECRLSGIGTQILDTVSVTVAGTYNFPVQRGVWDACRMGVKVTTDGGVQSITGGIAFQSAEQVPVVESDILVAAAPGTTTTGTSEELLYSIVIPSDTLADAGDSIRVVAHATTAANTNSKILRLRMTNCAGTAFQNTDSTTTSAARLTSDAFMIRNTSSELITTSGWICAGNTCSAGLHGAITGLDFTAPITLAICGLTSTQAGDMTLTSVVATVTN